MQAMLFIDAIIKGLTLRKEMGLLGVQIFSMRKCFWLMES